MNSRFKYFLVLCFILSTSYFISAQKTEINNTSTQFWLDTDGNYINAHGGGILEYGDKYYWFGESKDMNTNAALEGVSCYSSTDLLNWKNEGTALSVEKNDKKSDIYAGCILERPKVIYNKKTKKFVMWFHLELYGRGYDAARSGLAIADKVTGPYKYIHSYRPNAGFWPLNFPDKYKKLTLTRNQVVRKDQAEWEKVIEEGLFVRRDFEGGQMARDMTVYVDDDEKAYHIFASEENETLNIAELTDDYQAHTGKYIRAFPGKSNEAPTIFKKGKLYFMISSGCTGWAPNAARLHSATSMLGEWTTYPNPCVGENANKTFGSQSTHILPMPGKSGEFIFMADIWTPEAPKMGKHLWLPILFENGLPVLKWVDKWKIE